MIQVRNVPEDLHRQLKWRAAIAGMSLSDYLLREIRAVAQVIRRYAANRDINDERGRAVLADLAEFPLRRYPHDFLLPHIWELRNNRTAYDAAYVALAEAIDAPLLTRDRHLAGAARPFAPVELI